MNLAIRGIEADLGGARGEQVLGVAQPHVGSVGEAGQADQDIELVKVIFHFFVRTKKRNKEMRRLKRRRTAYAA